MVGHIAHVRWAAHGREMSSFVSAVRHKEVYSDCLLCCKDGYQVPAHRAVLAMASPFFNVIFRSYPATGSTPCIVLEGVDRDQIDALLHYIYFGSLIVKCDKLPALSKTAKSLGIKEFPSLEIAPSSTSSGREESRPRDDTFLERSSNRPLFDRAMSGGEYSEDNSWSSQPKKRKWDTPAVPTYTQDYSGSPPHPPRPIGNPAARSLHIPNKVPVLKQLLSPSYHIYSEKSQKVPNDFMPADLPDRAARETIMVSPNKPTATPLNQNKISEADVKMEDDSDELVEVCQLSDDDTAEPQEPQRNSSYNPADSSCLGKKRNAWASSRPQEPMPHWHPNTSILQKELGRPRSSSTTQDCSEEKTAPKTTSSLKVNLTKSGSQSVSPRPVHSPLTPPANRPNSVPTAGSTSCPQGPFDLSTKSSTSHVMSRPTPDRNTVHAEPLARPRILNTDDASDSKREIRSEEHVQIARSPTADRNRKSDTDFKPESRNIESGKQSNPSGDNLIILESNNDNIKRGTLKYKNLTYSSNSTSPNTDEKKNSEVYCVRELTSSTPLIYKNLNGTVTSTSTSDATKPVVKAGPPALLSMVNGTNSWKFRESSSLLPRSPSGDPSSNQKQHPSYTFPRPTYIPLNTIAPRTEKLSINSENYRPLKLPENNKEPFKIITKYMTSDSSFQNPAGWRGNYLNGESSEVKIERDPNEIAPPRPTRPDIPVDPLLTKITTTKRRRVRGPKSWEYLLRLLRDPSTNPSLIRWENEQEGIFRLVKPDAIALRWGKRTGKHCTDMLSYENFARGLRYHYVTGALSAVSERCFVYKFGPKAEKELKYSDTSSDVITTKIISAAPAVKINSDSHTDKIISAAHTAKIISEVAITEVK